MGKDIALQGERKNKINTAAGEFFTRAEDWRIMIGAEWMGSFVTVWQPWGLTAVRESNGGWIRLCLCTQPVLIIYHLALFFFFERLLRALWSMSALSTHWRESRGVKNYWQNTQGDGWGERQFPKTWTLMRYSMMSLDGSLSLNNQKPQEIAIFFSYKKAMEHLLDVCCYSHSFFAEPDEHPKESIVKVRSS